MAKRYWLFKSEPGAYSFDDLVNDGVAEWDGVRNFKARNYLRDEVKPGDGVLFYHSNADPIAIVGTAEVVREGYPDDTAWDPASDHPDPKSTPDNPIWYMVDLKPLERFTRIVTRDELKEMPQLANMGVLKRGNRLSIQPITEEEWNVVRNLGEPVSLAS